MTSRSILRTEQAFTLVELILVIALVGILSVVSIDLVTDSIDEGRFQKTVERIEQIKNAMIGNPAIKEDGTRTSFGFLGDIGALPTAVQGIASLVSQPAVPLPVYAINATARFGIGWNGPYLSGGDSDTDYTKDAWGTNFVYDLTVTPPTITSLGSNAAVGGTVLARDIVVSLPTELRVATVSGFICDGGGPFTALAQVELNYPNGSGVLAQTLDSITVPEAGQFSFASVPFGIRSITVYRPDKATATAPNTLGPILITVDRPNFTVPCSRVDIDP